MRNNVVAGKSKAAPKDKTKGEKVGQLGRPKKCHSARSSDECKHGACI